MARPVDYWKTFWSAGLNLDPTTGLALFSYDDASPEERFQRAYRSSGAWNPSVSPVSPVGWVPGKAWNPAVPPQPAVNINLGGVQAGGASPGNPFQTVRNVKDPAIQSAIDAALGQYGGLDENFAKNPFVVRSNVKDPAQQARIDAAGTRYEGDVAQNRGSLADFTAKYLGGDAEAGANQQQESGSIGDWYDGTVQGQLDALATARKQAVTSATQNAIARAQRMANVARLTTGPSSYINQQGLDTSANLMAQEAVNQADLGRTNLLTVKDQQSRLAGLRNNLLNQYLMRGLAPIQANQQVGQNELSQLGQLGAAGEQNNIYQLDSPESSMARRLGVLQAIQGLNAGNNFFGLRGPAGIAGQQNIPALSFPDFSQSHYGLGDLGASPGTRSATNIPNVAGTSISQQVAAAYRAITGQDPSTDPNVSQEMLNYLYNQLQAGQGGYAQRSAGWGQQPWQGGGSQVGNSILTGPGEWTNVDDIWGSLGA